MSLTNGKIGDLKLVHNSKADKPKSAFPIEVKGFPQEVFDKAGGYKQWIVAANGFVIAHFVDESSMLSYLNYIKQFGFKLFPKVIMDVLESQALDLNLKIKK